MSMDFDLSFTPLNVFLGWVQDQLDSLGGAGSTA